MTNHNLGSFDKDMLRVLKYHKKLVRLCKTLAAINVNGDLFDSRQIRWELENDIRNLLKRNGDFPLYGSLERK